MRKTSSILSLAILAACSSTKHEDLNSLIKKEAELQKQLSGVQEKIRALKKESVQPILVSVEKTTPQIFKAYLTFQAKADADDNISLSTEMPGTITKIYVKPGEQLKAGQILAETDARTIQQSIQALQSNLNFVNELYEKQKKLWEQKIGTEVQYLQVKSQKENLEKTLASLQEQLRMTKIISPIDGTVDAVDIKVGQMVAPGVPAIRVVNYNQLKVKADIPENYINQIHTGNPVQIIAGESDTINSKLSYVARTINNITRTFNVEVYVGNHPTLHTNQMVVLNINNYTSNKPVIAVSINYIQTDIDNKKFVYVVENNRAVKRYITVGKMSDDKVEILSGLNEGDQIIKSGIDIKDNTPVVIQQTSVL